MTQVDPKTEATTHQAHAADEHEHVHGPDCNHSHAHNSVQPFVRTAPKVGRNEPCLCGSGKKFKKCCGGTAEVTH